MSRYGWLACICVLPSCFVDVPDRDSNQFACASDDDCASGFYCSAGLCREEGGSGGDCGDGNCGPGESCSSCAQDCGSCGGCGNGSCGNGESCSSCPQDCGWCSGCGDTQCNNGESCSSCPSDCGSCAGCGDGSCGAGESCSTCPGDCGSCNGCGDGSCGAGESCSSCPGDCCTCDDDEMCDYPNESCSSCPRDCCPTCNNNGSCDPTETCSSCNGDCCPCNNNSVCDPNESCESCWDCGSQNGTCASGETCSGCAADCGACSVCGNTNCELDESCAACASDCGSCTLAIASGDGQSQRMGDRFADPLVVTLSGQGARQGIAVTFSSDAASFEPAVAVTDAFGTASTQMFAGRRLGSFTVTAVAADGSTVVFSASTVDIAGQSVFTLANAASDQRDTQSQAGRPAAVARLGSIRGVAADWTNGDIYLSDTDACRIYKVNEAGRLDLVAGDGECSFGGDGGAAQAAKLSGPMALAVDSARNRLLIVDQGNARVRSVSLGSGTISTLAGGGTSTGDGIIATTARLESPGSMALDPNSGDVLLVVGGTPPRLRRIGTDGRINTITTPQLCGQAIMPDGGVAVGPLGHIFFGATDPCDWARRIWRFTAGQLVAVAGAQSGSGSDDVAALDAVFGEVSGLAFDPADNLYTSGVIDWVPDSRYRVRRINGASSVVASVVGSGAGYAFGGNYGPASAASLSWPQQIAFTATGDLIIADAGNRAVRFVRSLASTTASRGEVLKPAGTSGDAQNDFIVRGLSMPLQVEVRVDNLMRSNVYGKFSGDTPGGIITSYTPKSDASGRSFGTVLLGRKPRTSADPYRFSASFEDLHGQAFVGSPVAFTATASLPVAGTILTLMNTAREVGTNDVSQPLPPAALGLLAWPGGVAVDQDGSIYVSDQRCVVWRIDMDGVLQHIAGIPWNCSFGGDGGDARGAQLQQPRGMAVGNGKLLIADWWNHRIREVDLTTFVINTVAGTGTAGFSGDNSLATSAMIRDPLYVAQRSNGEVYFSDGGNNRVRKVSTGGIISTLLDLNNGCPGSLAPAGQPLGLAVDSAGPYLYFVADAKDASCSGFKAVWRCTLSGASCNAMTRVAGSSNGALGDNGPATSAALNDVTTVAVAGGELFLTDRAGHRIRRVNASGTITTIAGNGTAGFSGDYGSGTAGLIDSPSGVAADGEYVFFTEEQNHVVRAVRR